MRTRGNVKANVKSTALTRRADFLAVAHGARVNSPAFTLQGRRRDDLGPIRVGFTVTKKNGTATERNRIRRRLREALRQADAMAVQPHHDYVLVGRRAALTRDFAAMIDDLNAALKRLGRQSARLVVRSQHSRPVAADTFANVGIKGPLEEIDSSGALDLTFACECSADGTANVKSAPLAKPDMNDET